MKLCTAMKEILLLMLITKMKNVSPNIT